MTKWVTKGMDGTNFDLHRQTIFYKAILDVLRALGEYGVPYVKLYLQNSADMLSNLIKIFKEASRKVGQKRSRVELPENMLVASS